MNVFLWVVVGAIVGVAWSYFSGKTQGMLSDVIVGIVGALLGGWLATLFETGPVMGFDGSSFVVAILGGIVLVWVARVVRRGGTSVQP